MKQLFVPKKVVRSIKEIDFAHLKSLGINSLILDIDDTLIPREVNDIYPDIFEWVVSRKQEGFKLCLTSNSRHPLRVNYIGQTLGIPALHLSFKPLPMAFHRSLKILQASPAETAMIGDQLFMDVLGANLANIYSIFVDHGKPESIWLRQLMRQAEQWVLTKLGVAGRT
ncbi:hypothetical protein A2311_04630 [candidate division WOR-1 bacterium RIFOXYB2_FULL_48_7]|uniref:HAD family hydrolase n=1 Tax=candidate division WOR-1 bacterium RIFOXYB2_FULL_48_7 TaxID=1802583 RepID=A0A1F4TS33_UNCSA|nr:MAG: hypothetical protein A2311_04630 [candidate division WOR-1 bacterium RIFOXYB2_FULL_48_7]